MDSDNSMVKLGEAASRFLAGLPPEEVRLGQQVLHQFVRWFGRERCLDDIKPTEIAKYSDSIPTTDADNTKKLNIIRDFLALARKKGWTKSNLTVHLKARKGKPKPVAGIRHIPLENISLTRQGCDEIKQELIELKKKRPGIVEDIQRAAADKDFRENAPLDAAREQLGHIEGRIRELEEILKRASVIDGRAEKAPRVDAGDYVVLVGVDTNEEASYTIVNPREVDPARGRISSSSPLGKAIIGRSCGEVIEITVPAGTLRYRIEKIGR
ncbi:MAG TPA: transcription elongation factor GreA [Dehalococcoidia bacterium]|nr:transcription elongation factor GreA [Dehalococcoidia bacterium]